MDFFVLVEIVDPQEDLVEDGGNFRFRKGTLGDSHEVDYGTAEAELHNEPEVALLVEAGIVFDDMRMLTLLRKE